MTEQKSKPAALSKFHITENHGKPNDAGIYIADFRLVAAIGPEVKIEEIRDYLLSIITGD